MLLELIEAEPAEIIKLLQLVVVLFGGGEFSQGFVVGAEVSQA